MWACWLWSSIWEVFGNFRGFDRAATGLSAIRFLISQWTRLIHICEAMKFSNLKKNSSWFVRIYFSLGKIILVPYVAVLLQISSNSVWMLSMFSEIEIDSLLIDSIRIMQDFSNLLSSFLNFWPCDNSTFACFYTYIYIYIYFFFLRKILH